MSDDIINFDLLIKKKQKYRQNKNSLTWPNRVVIAGQPGTGKTTLACQFILNPKIRLYYDRIYIFAADLLDTKYQLIKQKFEKMEKKIREETGDESFQMLWMENDLSKVPSVDSMDRDLQNLIIFDDFVTKANDKSHDIVTDYWIRSRRANCFCMYLSQSWYKTPKIVREATNVAILFRINNSFDISAIHRDLCQSMKLPEFKTMFYDTLKENKHGFVVIDMSDPDAPIRSTICPPKKEDSESDNEKPKRKRKTKK